jgi:Fic family protein
MYLPRFTLTPKMTTNLEQIGAVFGFIRTVTIPTQFREEYVAKIMAEAIHASTAIEGNTLTQEQVTKVIGGEKITAIDRDIKEVQNYHEILQSIKHVAKETNSYTEKTIRDIHYELLKGVNNQIAGKYRTINVTVGNYLPPNPVEVPSLMHDLVTWLNYPDPQSLSPLIYAGIVHYRLVAIHPFEDGNGRATRALTTLYLIKNGYDITNSFALESYYNRERKAYYTALSSADSQRTSDGEPDLTNWLEYFTTGILTEAVRAQSNITQLLQKHPPQPIHLSSTQKLLLKISSQNQTTQMSDYLKATALSQRGIFKALQQLIKGNLIEQHGELKGTYYTITDLGKQNISK